MHVKSDNMYKRDVKVTGMLAMFVQMVVYWVI